MAFKEYQEVIIIGMLINGDRSDVGGRYIRKSRGKGTKHVISVQGVHINIEEDKIVDAVEYWRKRTLRLKHEK